MIYVQIKAGLGNQMFEYAFGRAMALRRNEELLLDTTWYGNQASRDTKRDFSLDKYNINAKVADPVETAVFRTPYRKFLTKIKNKFFHYLGRSEYIYYPSIANSRSKYYEGHWITELYFLDYSDHIRKELTLKNPLCAAAQKIEDDIETTIKAGLIPVSLHVRRGDVVTNQHAVKFQGFVETSYYVKAREYIFDKLPEDKVKFFVFSDGIDWAKENIKHTNITYVSEPNISDYEEIHLMSKCSNHIIGNSSFSWWGAWLNPNMDKVVIAPEKWLADPSFNTRDALPVSWIKL